MNKPYYYKLGVFDDETLAYRISQYTKRYPGCLIRTVKYREYYSNLYFEISKEELLYLTITRGSFTTIEKSKYIAVYSMKYIPDILYSRLTSA